LSRRRALAVLLVAAQVPLLVGMVDAEPRPKVAEAPPPPPSLSNNIVGLNVARLVQPMYISAAADVVNANGGAWGYLTILLTRDDRDLPRSVDLLQQVLDRCFELRLQPIVRVGTRFDPATGIWERPLYDEPVRWRDLFDQARWPTPTVWIVPANEPNLGREWGGKVDAPSYARYLERFIITFADDDRYRVVNAPLNLSNAHEPPLMQDAFLFLEEMAKVSPSVFERLPAWASNSYQVDGLGDGQRFTHLGYEAELEAIGRDMPVLIIETGVLNRHGEDEITRFFTVAYRDWQRDRRVIAATPLVWDPDVDDHWMFTFDQYGNLLGGNATYRVLRELPRVAGSPGGPLPLENTARVSAAAVKARPLPIFAPDPSSPTGYEAVPEPAP
jgi:hypothetical protein